MPAVYRSRVCIDDKADQSASTATPYSHVLPGTIGAQTPLHVQTIGRRDQYDYTGGPRGYYSTSARSEMGGATSMFLVVMGGVFCGLIAAWLIRYFLRKIAMKRTAKKSLIKGAPQAPPQAPGTAGHPQVGVQPPHSPLPGSGL